MARTAYAVFLATLMGCGADWSPSRPQPLTASYFPPVLIRIAALPDITNVALRGQALLIATAYYADGTTGSADVTWTSSDETVCTVTGTGLVTGVSIGSAHIWVRSVQNPLLMEGCFVSVVAVTQPPVIVTRTLPNGTVGYAYSATLAHDLGSGAPEWSVISGSLPPGLTLNPATGMISGICASAGTYAFTGQVADHAGAGTQPLSITVAPNGGGDF